MIESKILVVEDDGLTAMGIQNKLIGLGYNVLAIVASGEKALKMAKELKPDLVLMDIKLQGKLDGVETAGQIRKHLDIPVVYLTAYTDEDTLQRAKITEPFGYLLKPIRLDSLKSTLEMALYKQTMTRILQESEERFRLAFENANVGMCLVDLDGRFTKVNRQMCEILGYSQQELESMTVNDIAYPEDVEISTAFIQRAQAGEVEHTTFEKRYLHKDGNVVWGQVSSSLVRDAQGNPRHLISHVQNITERKQAEKALQESEARYRRIIETAQEGIWIIDAESNTTFVNRKMAEMLGYTAEEMIGASLFAFMDEEGKATAIDFVDRQGIAVQQDLKLRRKDGVVLWVIVSTTSLFGVDGDYVGALAMMTDITERKQAEGLLRHYSTHDALTGLYNRAFFEEEMSRLEQARNFPVSLVIADVDDLKATNDRHGHAAGDELLRQAAQSLSAAFRREDVVARIGGDEFAVLLPNANEEGVEKALTRIFDNVQAYNATHREIPLKLSLGTSTIKKGRSLSEALKQADKRMYSEKHGKKK